jgi:hypothetical protein
MLQKTLAMTSNTLIFLFIETLLLKRLNAFYHFQISMDTALLNPTASALSLRSPRYGSCASHFVIMSFAFSLEACFGVSERI